MRIRFLLLQRSITNICVCFNCITFLCLLLSSCSPPDPARELCGATGLGTNEVAAVLEKHPSTINQRSWMYHNWTPLITAIYFGKDDIVAQLISRGADVNESDGNDTPLIWAINQWPTNTDLVQLLIRHGADPHITNYSGENAFDVAISVGRENGREDVNTNELVKILRQR
jgi:ankyrin repeat protein